MGKLINTFIFPIIRPDFIGQALASLYKYTEPDTFRVIVIDQTGKTEAYEKYHHLAHLWITSYRNLGFAKAMNTGIVLSQTPYITLCNDDIELLNKEWWQGILDTFAHDEKIIAVNPNSPKEGAWGYGLRHDNLDTWEPPEGFVRDAEDKTAVLPVVPEGKVASKEWFETEEGYNFLVNEHPRWKAGTVCDAIAMFFTVFKRTGLEEIGLLDEQFYPASGEDYDMDCRAYSCGFPGSRENCDPTFHRRMVGTTKSWIYHAWGKSKDDISGKDPGNPLFASRPRWNNNDELWSPTLDVWGHYTDPLTGEKKPCIRKKEIFIDEL